MIIVGAVYAIIFARHKSFPRLTGFVSKIQQAYQQRSLTPLAFSEDQFASVAGQLSETLDSLITHPGKVSPIVLGVDITNDSLNALVDVIQKLPSDQFSELKTVICTPASPSAQ